MNGEILAGACPLAIQLIYQRKDLQELPSDIAVTVDRVASSTRAWVMI